MSIKRLSKIALLTAFLSVSVYLIPPFSIPIINVAFTIQTLVIILIAYILKPVDALVSVSLYVLLGAIGLPIFSGAQGGLSVLLGPTGGFLILFPLVAYFISYFKSKQKHIWIDILYSILFGIVMLYLLSGFWLSYIVEIPYFKALWLLLPFVPFDLLKIVFARFIYQKLPSELLEN